MKNTETISSEYSQRIEEVLDLSWKIFKSQFINRRHEINTEAPFQHHFAQIIRNVGELYSINHDDLFKVDLETKLDKVRERSKYYDISCQFSGHIKCVIELKFKTKQQGAQDFGRIDSYVDLESLEIAIKDHFDLGKFYMITNDLIYTKESKIGSGTIFCMHDGFRNERNKVLNASHTKGKEHVFVKLQNQYLFDWEHINGWHFLDLSIRKDNGLMSDIDERKETDRLNSDSMRPNQM
jgi:hypothetical protein